MFIDDWPTQATRSLWLMMHDEHHQTIQKVIGNDGPTLTLATKRFRTWVEEKKIRIPKYPDPNFTLERELISCALDDVHWDVLTYRVAEALKISVSDVPDTILCPKCQGPICQMCLLCPNSACGNAHQIDCLSEDSSFQLGPLLFDFAGRKLV